VTCAVAWGGEGQRGNSKEVRDTHTSLQTHRQATSKYSSLISINNNIKA
jgi:hypothetical protein